MSNNISKLTAGDFALNDVDFTLGEDVAADTPCEHGGAIGSCALCVRWRVGEGRRKKKRRLGMRLCKPVPKRRKKRRKKICES